MSKPASVTDMVCPTHPERAAVTRCRACLKPICAECTVTARGEDFCGKTCANNHFVSAAHLAALAAREQARRRRQLIRRLIVAAVLFLSVCAAGVAWRYGLDAGQRRALIERIGHRTGGGH